MSCNTAPIYSGKPNVQWTTTAMTTANTTKDLTSGTSYLAFSGDATNGNFIQEIVFKPLGTNSNATVARIWLNNGATTGTASNNSFIGDVTLGATTNSETAANAVVTFPMNRGIGAYSGAAPRIYITLGTAPTSAGWQATVYGGDYTA